MEHTNTPETLKQTEQTLPTEHQVLLDWWRELDNHRGDRAALRRASSVDQVLFNPGFHRLWRKLKNSRWTRTERVALFAALAARVRQHDPRRSFAAQLGSPPAGREKSALSGLRFRRLIQTRDPSEVLQACSRAVAMCENRVNLLDLAESIYWWNERVHKQWAFDYYDANPKAD